MTTIPGAHEPRSEFRSALEEEVSRALRREVQATENARGVTRQRLMFVGRLAATLAIGVFVGAAPAQIQDAQRRDSLIAAELAAERIAASRVAMAEESYRLAVMRVQVGMAVSAAEQEAQLREVEWLLAVVRLNVEEIRASSVAPRNDLSAPIIGQRDFVKERLQLEALSANKAVISAMRSQNEAEQRKRVGGSDLELEDARASAMRAQARLTLLLGKRDLRDKFLKERLSPEEVARREQILELQQQHVVAEQSYRVAVMRLQNVRNQRVLGNQSDQALNETRIEDLRAELEMLEQQRALELIKFRLRALQGTSGLLLQDAK